MKPIVAISADCIDAKKYTWHACPEPYIDALVDVADVTPLIVPSVEKRLDADGLLKTVDGLLITGARSNIHPKHYKKRVTEDHKPFDDKRDNTTLPLIRKAIKVGVPLLAICRGIQELNVALGGTITAQFQKKRNLRKHRYPYTGTMDERFKIFHEVEVKKESCLYKILKKDRVRVNSLHTQALNELPKNVNVDAVAHDGTIEAISVKGAKGFIIGVQWHPEYWAKSDSPSNAIFKAFGKEVRKYKKQKRK